MTKFNAYIVAASLVCSATTAFAADSWTLDSSMSSVAFGSVKNEYVGESHTFGKVDGAVDANGTVTVEIDLTSVNTNIDIRNERMLENVFKEAVTATVTADIALDEMDALAVGAGKVVPAEGTVALLGEEVGLDASLFVLRVSEDRVLVTTDGMVMLSTDEAGLDAGIDILQELASLDSITRVSPVTMRLMFDRDS